MVSQVFLPHEKIFHVKLPLYEIYACGGLLGRVAIATNYECHTVSSCEKTILRETLSHPEI